MSSYLLDITLGRSPWRVQPTPKTKRPLALGSMDENAQLLLAPTPGLDEDDAMRREDSRLLPRQLARCRTTATARKTGRRERAG